MYNLKHSENFNVTLTESSPSDGIVNLHLTADCLTGEDTLEIRVNWFVPNIGIHAVWSPSHYINKDICADWGGYFGSCAMSQAPVMSNVDYHDMNRQTIACSDAKNGVRMHTGVVEEDGTIDSVVIINVDCNVSHYEADIRIDTRPIKFYEVVEDVVKWWETYDGYTPAAVPEIAKMPLYSAWYSYHQHIDIPAIVEECRNFAKLGCKVLIVDDGWQTDDNNRGYDYCGDWQPAPVKVPDMKAFVDAVHETGMKFVLWYSVPFVGEFTEAYERFKDKMLRFRRSHTYVLDPRYPDVREYLITLYKNAVTDWGLDGFKLDFVDSFSQSDVVKDGMDYVSVYDAVDKLLKDVIAELRAMNPDILIEFRQSYMGPLMRTFGNMIRSGDCPCDSWTNRMNTTTLRLTSGSTAVHSDMVMWHYDETPEQAAFQLTNVLFSVPQVSIKWNNISEGQRKMLSSYIELWLRYRDVLLDGKMLYKGYTANYPYVSSRLGETQVGAVYSGKLAYIEVPTDEIVLVNASLDDRVFIECDTEGLEYEYTIFNCLGEKTGSGCVTTGDCAVIRNVPVNGHAVLVRK